MIFLVQKSREVNTLIVSLSKKATDMLTTNPLGASADPTKEVQRYCLQKIRKTKRRRRRPISTDPR